MEFTACKHLDFADNYAAKKQAMGTGKVFWMREAPYEGAPRMVQFCKQRGRLNDPLACTSKGCAMCSDYEEVTHNVPDDSIAD